MYSIICTLKNPVDAERHLLIPLSLLVVVGIGPRCPSSWPVLQLIIISVSPTPTGKVQDIDKSQSRSTCLAWLRTKQAIATCNCDSDMRRYFSTSIARLRPQSTTSVRPPPPLRCSQILHATSDKDGTSEYEDREVHIHGFVRSVRKQKRVAFAEISDGSTLKPVQAILNPAQAIEYVRCVACRLAREDFRG